MIVDKVGLRKLFPGQGGETAKTNDDLKWFIGKELEMNDHRAVIVGICEATRTFQSNAVVYTTYSRAKRFVPQERQAALIHPRQDRALSRSQGSRAADREPNGFGSENQR